MNFPSGSMQRSGDCCIEATESAVSCVFQSMFIGLKFPFLYLTPFVILTIDNADPMKLMPATILPSVSISMADEVYPTTYFVSVDEKSVPSINEPSVAFITPIIGLKKLT